MFLRVRGKGASPENSQAAVMHLRGFRHVNMGPPHGSYTLLSCAADGRGCTPAARPFSFAHFAMGVQAKAVVQAQQRYDAQDEAEQQQQPEVRSPQDTAGDEERPMVWKETWNAYDIVYDEVPLLPASYERTNAQLRALAEAEAAKQSTLPALAELPAGYSLPQSWTGNQKAVVCTHYYADQALAAEALTARAQASGSESVGRVLQRPGLVVLDLSHVPAAEAHVKLAAELAWLAGFASVQPDLPLARARRVLVRLLYDAVPSPAWLQAQSHANGDENGSWPAAVLAMYDFLGEHLALTHTGTTHWAQLSLHALPAPPVVFTGKDTQALNEAGLRLLAEARAEAAAHTASGHVLYFIGDHRLAGAELTEAALATQVGALAEAWQAEVQVVKVPLKALIDGGEEPWDQYTQQERTRLNFCPCCGHCAGHDH